MFSANGTALETDHTEIGNAPDDDDAKGVALFDAALYFESGDDQAATRLVDRWHDGKQITATSIGRCPTDGRRQLYRLPEIMTDMTRINGLDPKEQNKLRNHLKAMLRTPR